jgi:hypothetical protein
MQPCSCCTVHGPCDREMAEQAVAATVPLPLQHPCRSDLPPENVGAASATRTVGVATAALLASGVWR